jgi:hypothetical protein
MPNIFSSFFKALGVDWSPNGYNIGELSEIDFLIFLFLFLCFFSVPGQFLQNLGPEEAEHFVHHSCLHQGTCNIPKHVLILFDFLIG